MTGFADLDKKKSSKHVQKPIEPISNAKKSK